MTAQGADVGASQERRFGALSRRLSLGKPSRMAAAALLAIAGVALVLRLVALTNVPTNVTADEADNLQVVYHILEGHGPGFFGLDWKPAPAFSTYLIAGFMRLFGMDIVGMRMSSVVVGSLTVVALYILARQHLSRMASLASAFLLATALWHLHFSRSGWENVHIGLYAVLAALSLALALKSDRWYWYSSAGLFAALGLYGYFGGRAIPVALLTYLPMALILRRHKRRGIILGYGIMVLVCIGLFAPQLRTAFKDWDYFDRRTEAVSILKTEQPYRGDSGLPKILAHQTWRAVDGLLLLDSGVLEIGLNARYLPPHRSVLDPITGGLFWLGLLVGLFRWRQTALWWTMLIALLLPLQILSTGTPDAARAVGASPFYFLFAGLALDFLWSLRLPFPRVLIFACSVALLALIAAVNVGGYFRWMNQPAAAAARQPAVEVVEFQLWQELQIKEARQGRWGFNVTQWHQMRERYPTKGP